MTGAPDSPLVYLDHAATTPLRPQAVSAMAPFHGAVFANPSGSHSAARAARLALDEARDVVAAVIGCAPGEIVFTGCGTESDNTAVLGAGDPSRERVLCHAAEHHAVLHAVEHVGGTVLPTDTCARLDRAALGAALAGAQGDTVRLVSVMAVNNEVGAIDDIADVAELAHAAGALVHTDAVQAAPWLDLRRLWPHVDLLALSAHKFGGPKGVGVLAVRSGVRLAPLLLGGGQERDRRSGTHNMAGIVATAAALAAADSDRPDDVARIGALRDRLVDQVTGSVDDVLETLARTDKVAGSAHLCIAGVESEALLFLLDRAGVCASAASACASGAMEPSHVLAAMGLGREWTAGAVRLSLGTTTTQADVDRASDVLVDAVRTLRRGAGAA